MKTVNNYKMIESEYQEDEHYGNWSQIDSLINQIEKEQRLDIVAERTNESYKQTCDEFGDEDEVVQEDEQLGIQKIFSMQFEQQINEGIQRLNSLNRGPKLICEEMVHESNPPSNLSNIDSATDPKYKSTHTAKATKMPPEEEEDQEQEAPESNIIKIHEDQLKAPPNSMGISQIFNNWVQRAQIYNIESIVNINHFFYSLFFYFFFFEGRGFKELSIITFFFANYRFLNITKKCDNLIKQK